MPLTEADFPYEAQVAFFMFRLLSDNWDGASGVYFGKDFSPIEAFFNIYDVQDRVMILELIKNIETHTIDYTNERGAQKRQAAERAASAKHVSVKG